MNILANLNAWILSHLMAFLGIDSHVDPKIVIYAAPKSDDREIIPFARTDVPYLGDDHLELIKKAEMLYDDDALRHKWLISVHSLRVNNIGWIMDKPSKARKSPKWGLTHSAV